MTDYARTSVTLTEDAEENTDEEIEVGLRIILGTVRARVATSRANPVMGRAYAMAATHVEDALRILKLPVP